MPKAKTQQANKENKENAPKVQETESYKLEEGKDDDDSGEDSDSSDEEENKDEKKPVRKLSLNHFYFSIYIIHVSLNNDIFEKKFREILIKYKNKSIKIED